jgi:glycolate oxidase iron-sulfur subunit
MLRQEAQSNQQMNPLIGVDFFSQKKLDACTHCGLCLPTCPTYRELGLETDSPRGRLYLMSTAFRDVNPTPLNEDWAKYIYRCLDCRACETACPSGVQFGELVEEARAIYELNTKRPKKYRMWTNLVFKRILPKRLRLNLIFELLWLYQRLGIRSLVRRSGILKMMGKMGEMEAMMPEVPTPTLKFSLRKFSPAKGKAKYRVGFVSGCMMNQLFTQTNLATVRVLQENGCDVITPRKQNCCGALHVHNGVRDVALGLARQNIDAFEGESLDAIIINSAGCGATLKEYDVLMEHDTEYAEKATRFSEKMRDISEFLAEIGITPPEGEIKRSVTYDEPCHLVHGQNVHDQPRQLLQSIPGLHFVELRESEWCCGSAGIYNITQPDMSRDILERKMKHIADTEAEIVATGNPGCILQIQLGVREHGLPMKVMHPVDLLDCAYRGIDPLA